MPCLRFKGGGGGGEDNNGITKLYIPTNLLRNNELFDQNYRPATSIFNDTFGPCA